MEWDWDCNAVGNDINGSVGHQVSFGFVPGNSKSQNQSCDIDFNVPGEDDDSKFANTISASCSVQEVFSNAVVWRRLEKCLNFTDLKCLRLVCQEFNQNIINETNFKSRTFISMKAYKIEDEVFQPTTVWKHYKLEFSNFGGHESEEEDEGDSTGSHGRGSDDGDDDEEMSYIDNEENDLLADSYSDVEDMSEGDDDGHDESYDQYFEDMCEEDNSYRVNKVKSVNKQKPNMDWIYELLKDAESLTVVTTCDISITNGNNGALQLKRLLEAPKRLLSLSLDVHTIDINYKEVFSTLSDAIRSTFEHLSEFHILPTLETLGDLCTEVDDFSNAMSVLSSVMKNLKIFSVPKFVNENNGNGVQYLLKIVEANRSHLINFTAAEANIWSTISSMDINFHYMALSLPRLVSLKIVISPENTKRNNIMHLLRALPFLEQLEISISPKFPVEFLNFIFELGKLKVLRLRSIGFDSSSSHYWSFLSKLEKLEEIQVALRKNNRSNTHGVDVGSILSNLPKSTHRICIKEIYQSGIAALGNNVQSAIMEDFAQLNPLVVTVLNLRFCNYFVTDSVMESICTNFRMLRKLDVSGNTLLTDYGFTGIRPENLFARSTFSIKNLKGLRCLAAERCCNITDATLFHGIKFLELTHLDLSDCNKITEDGIMAVIESNPSLEILKSDIAVSMDFLLKFPRLRLDTALNDWCEIESHGKDDDLADDDDVSADEFDLDSDSVVSGTDESDEFVASDDSGSENDPHELEHGDGIDFDESDEDGYSGGNDNDYSSDVELGESSNSESSQDSFHEE